MKKIGIYSIRSKTKGKSYIGSSCNIDKRWLDHKRLLKNNRHPNLKLQGHYNKYGIGDFVFEVIEYCERKMLLEREQVFIDLEAKLFNVCKVAGSSKGFRHTDESKKAMSKAKKSILLENGEWASPKKGKPRGYDVTTYKGGANANAKKIYRVGAFGERKIYDSLSSVNDDGFIFQYVYRAIKRGYKYKGFVWGYCNSIEGV